MPLWPQDGKQFKDKCTILLSHPHKLLQAGNYSLGYRTLSSPLLVVIWFQITGEKNMEEERKLGTKVTASLTLGVVVSVLSPK